MPKVSAIFKKNYDNKSSVSHLGKFSKEKQNSSWCKDKNMTLFVELWQKYI